MLWFLLLAASAGADPNLLQNPGFEQVSAGLPEQWDLFVKDYEPLEKPDVAARGAVDTVAHEGKNSAFLYNPIVYRSEPCNNWSQTVWGVLEGKKLRLSGAIKTEEATTAALWVQCWQRTPYKLLSVSSTSDKTPVSGTSDWRDVEMTVDVPAGTGFVMVRCVLRGKGKVWFDDLSLTEIMSPAKQHAIEPEKPESIPIPTPKANEAPDIRELKAVAESLRSYSKSNQDLLQEVQGLQQEIQGLRDQLKVLKEAADKVDAAPVAPPVPPPVSPPPEKRKPVPPLVPHGLKLEDLE